MSAFGKNSFQLGREHIRQLVGAPPLRRWRTGRRQGAGANDKTISRRAPGVSPSDIKKAVRDHACVNPLTTVKP
jgi:hypothetical protein